LQDRRTLYRLELFLPDWVLYPGLEEPGGYHWFTSLIGPPVQADGSHVRFNVDEVEMTSHDPRPMKVRLSGTIVAKLKDSPSDFEYKLKEWNNALGREERQDGHP
jgi:hypothetical protein